MNILFFGYADPFGILNMASKAINKLPEHESRVVTLVENKGFDSDISLSRDMWGGFTTQEQGFWGGIFKNLVDWSDVVVIIYGMAGRGNDGSPIDDLDIKMDQIPMLDILKKQNKKVVGLLSGSLVARNKSSFYIRLCKDNKFSMCTYQPELSISISEKYPCQYLPIILDVNHPRYKNSIFDFVNNNEFNIDKLMISHSLMSRGSSDQDKVLKVIDDINDESKFFIPIVINNCGFYDSLMMKKSSHIGIDMELDEYSYSGIGSFENTLLGLINITSTSQNAIDLINTTYNTKMPWIIVNSNEELKNALLNIKENKNNIYNRMLEARNFALQNFNENILTNKWIDFLKDI